MRMILFASGGVGLQLAQFMGQKEALVGIVVNANDDKELQTNIIAASGIQDRQQVFYSNEVDKLQPLKYLKKLKPDLGILGWWPYILKSDFIEVFRLGCLNLHPSLLPHNRGKDPNFWSIIENTPYGVTIHAIDSGIDSGPIAFQREIESTWEDSGETLYAKAKEMIVELFKEKFEQIQCGDIPRIINKENSGSFHERKELVSASKIVLDKQYTGREILNILRAKTFHPHSGAQFEEGGSLYEVRIEIKKIGKPERGGQ